MKLWEEILWAVMFVDAALLVERLVLQALGVW